MNLLIPNLTDKLKPALRGLKTDHFLILLLLVFLPNQLGLHFWPSYAFIYGQKVDYLSPTVFLLDLVCFSLIISYFWTIRFDFSSLRSKSFKIISLFLLVCALASLRAEQPLISLVALLRLVEVVLTALIIARQFKKIPRTPFLIALNTGAFLESILALSQFTFQHSFNLKIIGERSFDAYTPAIAKASVFGELLLRSYGSFPHPNVLAAYLAVVITINLWVLMNLKVNPRFYLLLILVAVELVALAFSFSRAGLAALLVGAAFLGARKLSQLKRLDLSRILLYLGLTLSLLVWLTAILGSNPDSLDQRMQLNSLGLDIIFSNPILGAGLSHFIVIFGRSFYDYIGLPSSLVFLQPIHNLWLLVCVEVGLLGLSTLLVVVYLAIKNSLTIGNRLYLALMIEVLFLSLFDHYFWTLIQGQLIFWIITAIVIEPDSPNEKTH